MSSPTSFSNLRITLPEAPVEVRVYDATSWCVTPPAESPSASPAAPLTLSPDSASASANYQSNTLPKVKGRFIVSPTNSNDSPTPTGKKPHLFTFECATASTSRRIKKLVVKRNQSTLATPAPVSPSNAAISPLNVVKRPNVFLEFSAKTPTDVNFKMPHLNDVDFTTPGSKKHAFSFSPKASSSKLDNLQIPASTSDVEPEISPINTVKRPDIFLGLGLSSTTQPRSHEKLDFPTFGSKEDLVSFFKQKQSKYFSNFSEESNNKVHSRIAGYFANELISENGIVTPMGPMPFFNAVRTAIDSLNSSEKIPNGYLASYPAALHEYANQIIDNLEADEKEDS